MTLSAVCFDLDDTLYPYDEYARAGLRAAADRLADVTGHRLHNELADLYFEEGITPGIFDRLLDRHDEIPDRHTTEMVRAYHDVDVGLSPYRDTTAVLELLRDRHALGLLADGRNVDRKLRMLGLAEYFETVVATARLDAAKTDRDPFERLLSGLSVPPDGTIYVGDDPRTDFEVPNRLGMGTVRVRRGRFSHLDAPADRAEANVEIARLEELPPLIDESTTTG
ncbi:MULTISPECIES: HAD family hydrolase [Salinibaculum]|uniref:HAD family hydrolase n=1 Tax=Salinibaculum TaxID=2732368 RepID=UPI0030CD7D42